MSTRVVNPSLASALFGKTRRAVLGLLYGHPEDSFFLRQVARAVGSGQGSVQRELGRLTAMGIIKRVAQGRQVYYQADERCPIFPELRGLVLKTVGLADVLRGELSPLADKITVAFVYGSQATGKATASSDVDLLVVGDIDEMRLHRAVEGAEKQLGRTVNYTLLRPRELARRRREKDGFLARVLAGAQIPILGVADEV